MEAAKIKLSDDITSVSDALKTATDDLKKKLDQVTQSANNLVEASAAAAFDEDALDENTGARKGRKRSPSGRILPRKVSPIQMFLALNSYEGETAGRFAHVTKLMREWEKYSSEVVQGYRDECDEYNRYMAAMSE